MKSSEKRLKISSNLVGAFADTAILLPLVVTLSRTGGMHGPMLLFSTGLAYFAAGIVFRVPMSVQPLKSVAIAGVTLGATALEIRSAGLIIALFCLLAVGLRLDRWAAKVPASLIHSIQFGLGILLILQGGKTALALPSGEFALASGFLAVMVLGPRLTAFPFLGLLATCGVFYGTLKGIPSPAPLPAPPSPIRPGLLLGLVLPQLALTTANSVLGTRDVARKYFGDRAKRVTVRNLLLSIGLGNILSSALGGLPFCHGSGGVTAHYRGGAFHWVMNLIAGTLYLVLAALSLHRGTVVIPPALIASLFAAIGIFHLILAEETWKTASGRLQLLLGAILVIFTQNLLIVLLGCGLFEVLKGFAADSERRRNGYDPI